MFKLPALASLFGKTAPSVPTLTAASAKPPAIDVTPPPSVSERWVDDSQLRALAQDYRDNISRWVIAGDMNEFFQHLDAYNAGKPDHEKIHLEILESRSDLLESWRDMGWHDESQNPQLKQKGPIEIKGAESLIRLLGPQRETLRVRMGGAVAPAVYEANVLNTKLRIQAPTGEWKPVYFGLGNDAMAEFFPKRISKAPAPQNI